MDFQENASNGRQDTADSALRSPCKEPFILVSGKALEWKLRYNQRYFFLQITCP